MNALADAGIYLALDVNTPLYSIRRDLPSPSYNKDYLQSVFATVEKFAKYDNTLLFFSANEVINDDATTFCAPYVKALTRDIKSYINARKLRKVPVGYSAADVESNRYEMAEYLNCGDDAVRSDFYAFNDYSWCDPSTFQTAGWDQKVAKFKDYSIPIFLSEYGCNKGTREFNEVASIYGSDMSSVYSGGLVYEYSQEKSNYGLVDLDASDPTKVSPRPDFNTLKGKFEKTPLPSGDGGYKTGGSASQCPSKSATWNVTMSADQLPAYPSDAMSFLQKGAGKGPGLAGKGSQDSGPQSPTLSNAADGAVTSGGSTSGTGSGSGSSPTKGAASSLRADGFSMAPVICGAIVLVSSMLGGSLLF